MRISDWSSDVCSSDLYGRCDQRFAVIANPLATNMAFDGEHAGCVVQLFADVFTDTLECAAARAASVVRFMMDQRAWEFRRQCRALGLLLFLGRRWRYLQGLKDRKSTRLNSSH